ALLPTLIVVYAQLGEYEVNHSNNGVWDVRSSVTVSTLVALTLLGVLMWMWRGKNLAPSIPLPDAGRGS
ncbi:MAG TPA: hypothetical protein VF120_11805, partial [Ktedonobacterales bacterium]